MIININNYLTLQLMYLIFFFKIKKLENIVINIIYYKIMKQSTNTFLDLEEIRTYILNKTNSVDLTLQLPPYLSSVFHPLRQWTF